MLGWGTVIKNSKKEKLCMGWITSDPWKSSKKLFGDDVIETWLNAGYSNSYSITVKALKDFCNEPDRYEGLKKNIYGSHDFSQPFDPELILDAINDMNDDETLIIEEWDES